MTKRKYRNILIGIILMAVAIGVVRIFSLKPMPIFQTSGTIMDFTAPASAESEAYLIKMAGEYETWLQSRGYTALTLDELKQGTLISVPSTMDLRQSVHMFSTWKLAMKNGEDATDVMIRPFLTVADSYWDHFTLMEGTRTQYNNGEREIAASAREATENEVDAIFDASLQWAHVYLLEHPARFESYKLWVQHPTNFPRSTQDSG